MPPVIAFSDAVILVGGFPVLAGVSCTVEAGETVLLHGANGAGKTSLLRACAGLLALSAGSGVVLGHDLRIDRESVRAEIGLVSHQSALYEDLSVEDNVRFAVRAGHADVGRVAPALERLGLTGRLARTRCARLSAGQRRRAGLAVLVARWPRLWLLDEPHAGLDKEGRGELDGLIAEARRDGVTVLLATHEIEHGTRLADRALELVGGATRPRLLEGGQIGVA